MDSHEGHTTRLIRRPDIPKEVWPGNGKEKPQYLDWWQVEVVGPHGEVETAWALGHESDARGVARGLAMNMAQDAARPVQPPSAGYNAFQALLSRSLRDVGQR